MQKEIITCENTLEIGDIRLTPLIRLSLVTVEISGVVSFHATYQPAYVIIATNIQHKIYRINGEEISSAQLRAECPGLEIDSVAY